MHTNFVDHFLQTLSWTFIHSLWQGLLLSIIAGMIMLLTKRSTASLRYILLTGSFFLFLCGIVVSFFVEWNAVSADAPDITGIAASADMTGAFYHAWIQKITPAISSFLIDNSYWIVSVWAVIIFFKTGRMLLDLMYVSRLRSQQIYSPGEEWGLKLQQMATWIGIRKTVSMVESALIKIPVVIGHLKPVILMPAGIFSNLSPGEVEAVLLHELAHIRRHDYLVNFVQRITEMILFFNPALLWVSSLMRIERENCCDDIAIAKTDDRLQFAEALISFREYSMKPQQFAMSLFGKKNVLLQRMTRIVYRQNKTLSVFEMIFFSINLLLFLFLVLGTGKKEEGAQVEYLPFTSYLDTGTLFPLTRTEHISSGEMSKQKPVPAVVHKETKARKAVPAKAIDEERIEETTVNAEAEEAMEQLVHFVHAQEKRLSDIQQLENRKLQAERDREQAMAQREQAEKDRQEADVHRKLAEIDRMIAQKHREQAERDRQQADKDRQEAEEYRKKAEEDRRNFEAGHKR